MPGINLTDIAGLKFGRLTALRKVGYKLFPGNEKHSMWECLCECGTLTVCAAYSLGRGHTKSCGCLHREVAATVRLRHGHTVKGRRSKTWLLWKSMRARPVGHDPAWDRFETFLSDMGECPEGLSLDRIDNEKGYSKDNCRWVTPKEQVRNRRITKMVEFEGKMVPMIEVAERLGIKYHTIYLRYRRGMRGADLTAPLRKGDLGKLVLTE